MTNNELIIAEFLIKEIGNEYGAFGLMGNLKAESACNPKNLQNSSEKKLGMTDDEYTKAVDNGKYTNFVNDSAGYGLAQWTYWSRKKALLEYVKTKKTSVGDINTQLEFLVKEIRTYKGVYSVLEGAKSIKEASDKVLTGYEKPANQDDSVKKKRASYGEAYYKEYQELKTKSVDELTKEIKELTKELKAKEKEIDYLSQLIAEVKEDLAKVLTKI